MDEHGDGEPGAEDNGAESEPEPDPEAMPRGREAYRELLPLTSRRRRIPEEGVLEVFVADEQSQAPVASERWAELAEKVLNAEGIRGDAELSILFVDEQAITDLNRRFMGEDGPTDVLAFPIEEEHLEVGRWPDNGTPGPVGGRSEPGEPPLLLGDVVICPAVARRNVEERGDGEGPAVPGLDQGYEDELALLVVHGVLHVLGMDHAEEAEAAAMKAKEQDLLDRFYRR